jgi:hypothetical protein
VAAEFRRARRYYLRKRLYYSRVEEDEGQASVWRSKQESEPGTALSSDFPYQEMLVNAGYSTLEDIDGADADELCEIAGFTASMAITILSAVPTI